MVDVRGTMSLVPMMKAAVVLSVGIALGDAAGERLEPFMWLLAALATALLAFWAREKILLGSLLVWLTVLYLGAFSMSWKISSDGPRHPFPKASVTALQEKVETVRQPVVEEMRDRLLSEGMTDDALSVMTAMTIAERKNINHDLREAFSVAGISHILALSGMHVGIIALMLGMLLGGRHRKRTEIIVIGAIWTYVLMAGLPTSAVRAALMLSAWSFISLSRRHQHPMNVLGTAMLLMLVLNPVTLFDVGFQLSCSAVFFLLLCMPFLMDHCPWKHRAGKWLWGILATSFVAQVATAPLVAFYFGRFSVYSLLANMLAVPLSPVVIVIGLLTMLSLLLPFGLLTAGLVWAENRLVELLLNIVYTVADLPGASVEGITLNAVQVALMYVILICLVCVIRKLDFNLDFARNL